jgi:uncharacterized membrane protein YphA (DoxX/SURF4 family)
MCCILSAEVAMLPVMMSQYLLAFCRIVIGLVFVVSSVSKARDLAQFKQTVSSFQLLPKRLSGGAALLFLGGEFVVALLVLIGGPLLLPGFFFAIGLLLLFSTALLSVLVRNIRTSCDCFGSSARLVSRFDVWRNVGFILCALGGCLALIWVGDRPLSLSLPEWILPGLAAALFVLIWSQLGEIAHLFRQD